MIERHLECVRCGLQRVDRVAPSDSKVRAKYNTSATNPSCTQGHKWRVTMMRAPANGPAVVAPDPTELDEFEEYRDDLIAFEEYKEKLKERYS